jgi:hypothetical protein
MILKVECQHLQLLCLFFLGVFVSIRREHVAARKKKQSFCGSKANFKPNRSIAARSLAVSFRLGPGLFLSKRI